MADLDHRELAVTARADEPGGCTLSKKMFFNFFVMNTPSHIHHGTWRDPSSHSLSYNDLDLWVDLARLAERGKVDAVFFADVFGMYADQGGSFDSIISNAVQFPISSPNMLISAMAKATEHLGFVYTNSVLQQHPFAFAREMSTLDHLTKGRMGWNMVTSASANGSRSMGLPNITDHEERYRWAEEYVEVVYKLWEASWEDDAVLRDVERGIYADPAKVHKINHVGNRYSVEGPHLVEPSPQRTPVLFQAGASSSGQGFAGRHTEGAFIISGSPEAAANRIRAISESAVAAGRRREDILFLEGLTFVVGSTEEEARRKEAELDQYISAEAELLLRAGAIGLDISRLDPETRLVDLMEVAQGMRGGLQVVIDAMPKGRIATVRDLVQFSSRQWRIVGTPGTIADRLEEYRAAGVDGINIFYITLPGTFTDFVDHIAPELQRRGLMQREYAPGTLREKMFPNRGPRLTLPHPAARYRPHASVPAAAV